MSDFDKLSDELAAWGANSGFLELPPFDRLRMITVFSATSLMYMARQAKDHDIEIKEDELLSLFKDMVTKTFNEAFKVGYPELVEMGKDEE